MLHHFTFGNLYSVLQNIYHFKIFINHCMLKCMFDKVLKYSIVLTSDNREPAQKSWRVWLFSNLPPNSFENGDSIGSVPKPEKYVWKQSELLGATFEMAYT